MKALISILIVIIFVSCAGIKNPPKVRHCIYSKQFFEYDSRKEKIKKQGITPESISIYDTLGNEIIYGEYGEIRKVREVTKLNDSSYSMVSHSFLYPKKLRKVSYKKYNSRNQVMIEEEWAIYNNKRWFLYAHKAYSYHNTLPKKIIEHKHDGEINSKETFVYDFTDSTSPTLKKRVEHFFGRSISEEYYYYLDTPPEGQKVEYKHSISTWYDDVTYGNTATTYDLEGKILNTLYNNKLYREYLYNKAGNLKSIVSYSSQKDNIESRKDYTYNKQGLLVQELHIDLTTNETSRIVYQYKKNGLVKKIEYFEDEEIKMIKHYSYLLY